MPWWLVAEDSYNRVRWQALDGTQLNRGAVILADVQGPYCLGSGHVHVQSDSPASFRSQHTQHGLSTKHGREHG